MGEGRLNAESRSALHAERISAAAPLIAASRRPSVTSCLRIRARLAPSAVRTPISRCRSEARASSRPATLKHAIRSTIPTTASPIHPTRATMRSSGTPSLTGKKLTLRPALVCGCASASWLMMPRRSACACAAVTPGFRRPARLSHSSLREVSAGDSPSRSSRSRGSHRSGS